MASHYVLSQIRNGLRISTRDDGKLWARVLAFSFVAASAALVMYDFIGNWSWAFGLLVATASLANGNRTQAVLDATNVEFVLRRESGRSSRKTIRTVCTGDVRGLEFRYVTSRHGGLFAITARGAECILPSLDYAQATEIIRAIEARFPGLAEAWHSPQPSSQHFLTLGLGKAR